MKKFLFFVVGFLLFMNCENRDSSKSLFSSPNHSFVSTVTRISSNNEDEYYYYVCNSEVEAAAARYIELCISVAKGNGIEKNSGRLHLLTIVDDPVIIAYKRQCLSRYESDLSAFVTALEKYVRVYFLWSGVEYSENAKDMLIRCLINDF